MARAPSLSQAPVKHSAIANKPAFASNAQRAASEIVAVPEIHSIEDLLALEIPGRPAASRARLERAVADLSIERLAAFATQLVPQTEACELVSARWTELAPIPALEATLSSGRYDYMAAKTAILAIFETDPATAVRMLALFPEHSRGDSISTRNDCISLLQGMSPQGALTFIMDMDAKYRNDRQTAQHVGPFGETWVKSDPTAAMNWALSQPSCFTRQQILAQMVKTWGETDAVSARSFLSEVPRNTLPNGPLRDRLMAEISKGEDSNEGKTER